MSKSYQLRVIFLSLALAACGGDAGGANGPINTTPANVVIVNASTSSIRVQNNGGAGEFYVEVWDHSFYNGPGGTTGPIVRVGHTEAAAIDAGVARNIGNPGGSLFRILAFTRGVGTTNFFQSSCSGNC